MAIPAAGQVPGGPNVTGVGGGLASSLSSTVSADPCSLYEPNSACTNARGQTVTIGFLGHNHQTLTCANFPPFYGERPYVETDEYSIDTDASSHQFTDPGIGIPLNGYAQDPTTGKTIYLEYSIEITNWGSKKTFTPVLACT
jgi:hypothetical protein